MLMRFIQAIGFTVHRMYSINFITLEPKCRCVAASDRKRFYLFVAIIVLMLAHLRNIVYEPSRSFYNEVFEKSSSCQKYYFLPNEIDL